MDAKTSLYDKIPNVFLVVKTEEEANQTIGRMFTVTLAIALLVYFGVTYSQQLHTFVFTTQSRPYTNSETISVVLGCTSARCMYSLQKQPSIFDAITLRKGETLKLFLSPSTTIWSMTSQDGAASPARTGIGSCLGTTQNVAIQTSDSGLGCTPYMFNISDYTVRDASNSGVLQNEDSLALLALNNVNIFATRTTIQKPSISSTGISYAIIGAVPPSTVIILERITETFVPAGSIAFWQDIAPRQISGVNLAAFRSFLQCPTQWDGVYLNVSSRYYTDGISTPVPFIASTPVCTAWTAAIFFPLVQESSFVYTTITGAIFAAASAAGGLYGVALLLIRYSILMPLKKIVERRRKNTDLPNSTKIVPAAQQTEKSKEKTQLTPRSRVTLRTTQPTVQ